ncbi:MAG: hypothetical protein R3B68_06195 [Phycisphaerales bacterium]
MAQILVRGLSEAAVERLKEAARAKGRSLQAEVRELLERAAMTDRSAAVRAAERIRKAMKGKTGGDSTEMLRELRQRWER